MVQVDEFEWTIEEQPSLEWEIIEAVIKPEQTKDVTPTYEPQSVTPDEGFMLGRVNVAAIPDPTDEINITENGDYNVSRIGTAHVGVPQGVFPTGTKEITENGTGIDVEQYAAVDVAVPQGVFPTGTKEITENGTGIDVTNYAAVDVNVPGIVPTGTKQISITANGTTTHDVTEYAAAEIITNVSTDPEKGLVFGDYDSNGYPHSARFVGTWTEIPAYYCLEIFGGTKITKNINSLSIPYGVTRINNEGCRGCTGIKTWSLPTTITEIGDHAFYQVASEEFIMPDSITLIESQAFRYCATKRFKMSAKITSIPLACFMNASSVELYDFSTAESIPSLYDIASLGHKSGCVIRIPAALSDTTLGTGNGWESATNWSALTNIVWEVV